MHHRPSLAALAASVILIAGCDGRSTTHLPATTEVGWVEFVAPSRSAPVFTIIAHQSALARVALDAKPGEPNDDTALLAQLTEEAHRPLVPVDAQTVTAPPVGCSAETILIATRSGHVVIMTARSLARDGQPVEAVSHRWFLTDDGTLQPILP